MGQINPNSRHAPQTPVREIEIAAGRRGMPHPVITRPTIAAPTVLLWLGLVAVWTSAAAVVLSNASRWWLAVTFPVQGFVTFAMFTVLHESIHSMVGRPWWVNQLFGRLAMPFVSFLGTFPMVKYVHIAHHRNTNECIDLDPDAWTNVGPRWQLPLRCLTIDAWYARFYFARLRRRPPKEIAGFLINLVVVIALLVAAAILWDWALPVVLIYVIPQRIGIGLLGLLFDWLPHHDLNVTAKVDRFRASRVRVGWERLMSPVLLYQNYHAMHQHPSGSPVLPARAHLGKARIRLSRPPGATQHGLGTRNDTVGIPCVARPFQKSNVDPATDRHPKKEGSNAGPLESESTPTARAGRHGYGRRTGAPQIMVRRSSQATG